MIGVIADDITGANDIGLMFARHHLTTLVAPAADDLAGAPSVDVLILDTDSRFDPPAVAYRKVHDAARRLLALGCTPLFKKTCSVFRGNVGAEFDALLDACGAAFMVVSAAYPKNGRQTRNGVHFVHGVPLADSPFSRDPVNPMRESRLASILATQTRLRIAIVPLAVVCEGVAALRVALERERKLGALCVVDAETQDDIAALAAASHDLPLFGGSAALAEELPRFWPPRPARDLLAGFDGADAHGVLLVSGSLTPQSLSQTAAARAAGVRTLELDSRHLLEESTRANEISRVVDDALPELRAGQPVLIHASQDAAARAATAALAAAQGLDAASTGRIVSAALAEAVAALVDATGLKRLVVAGGDTSGAVCRRLNLRGTLVLEEVAPGVPSCLALGRPLLLVLKSGSFGESDFLLRAASHLRALAAPVPLCP